MDDEYHVKTATPGITVPASKLDKIKEIYLKFYNVVLEYHDNSKNNSVIVEALMNLLVNFCHNDKETFDETVDGLKRLFLAKLNYGLDENPPN